MVLAEDEVEQFYGVWIPLLHFVNQQLKVVRSFPASSRVPSINLTTVFKLREALWANDSLLETFVEQNPANLTPEELALVASWKYRLAGHFFVLRYLKKYTVFLSNDSPVHAYGVFGLASPIEEMFGPTLPIYVQAVLLPFGDRIIYDSLITPYSVFFGPGIRADLNHDYRRAQENEGIITSLQPGIELPGQNPQLRQKKVLAAFQKELGRAGLSPTMITQHKNNINALAQAMQQDLEDVSGSKPTRGLLDLDQGDVNAYLSQPDANAVSLKRFITFLRDTDRMDYEKAQDMLDSLKRWKKGN